MKRTTTTIYSAATALLGIAFSASLPSDGLVRADDPLSPADSPTEVFLLDDGDHEHDHTLSFDEHDDHHHFDYFEPHHHRHETAAGYPFFEMLVTDHALLERKIRVDFAHESGADGGAANESEFEFELFWAINNRIAVVVEAPLKWIDSSTDGFTSGFGDLEVGFRFLAFNGERDLITFGLNVVTPTGDASRDLGEGHTALEPVMLTWHDFGCGWVFQSEVAFEIPVDLAAPEDEVHYNLALSKTLPQAAGWCHLWYLTPLVEVNGITHLNGADSGRSFVNLTPGFRWGNERKRPRRPRLQLPGDRPRDVRQPVCVQLRASLLMLRKWSFGKLSLFAPQTGSLTPSKCRFPHHAPKPPPQLRPCHTNGSQPNSEHVENQRGLERASPADGNSAARRGEGQPGG